MPIRAGGAADVGAIEKIVERAYGVYVERIGMRPGPMNADYAEDEARAAGLAEMRLYTHSKMTENRAMYARLGYRETDRRDEEGFDRVFFVKRLEPEG